MKIYMSSESLRQYDREIFKQLVNCDIEICNLETDAIEENVIIVEGILCSLPKNRIDDIKNIKNKILLAVHNHKSLHNSFENILTYKNYLQTFGFDEEKIYIVTQLFKDIESLKEVFSKSNFLNSDRWLNQLFDFQIQRMYAYFSNKLYSENNFEIKKFSLFCNRFEKPRLEIFCELMSLDLLDSFHYTFANAYNDPIESIKASVPEKYSYMYKVIDNWIDKIPYKVPKSSLVPSEDPFYPMELKHLYEKSLIHICLETEPTDKSFLTEKTYRAMLYKKPFILISQYEALEFLKAEGFKTFSPWINEDYDKIENFEDRKKAIFEEIKRLNTLPDSELNEIVRNCELVCEHNKNQLFENVFKPIPENFKISQMFKTFESSN